MIESSFFIVSPMNGSVFYVICPIQVCIYINFLLIPKSAYFLLPVILISVANSTKRHANKLNDMKNKLNKILSSKLKNYILYLGKYYAILIFFYLRHQRTA